MINLIILPSPVNRQGNEIYTVGGYEYLRVESGQIGLGLRNLSSRTVTSKRGAIMAHLSAANKVLPKLALGIVTKASSINAHLSAHLGANIGIKNEPMHPVVP